MLQVCFDCYGSYTTDSVYQWDLNRRLAIRGLDYDSAPAIHFSNKKSTEALVVQSTIEDGVIYCDVPNILLQEHYDIVGYVCSSLDQELTTYETIRIPVKQRVKPADYAYSDNVEILTYYALMSEITSVKASTEKDLNIMDASKASKAELNAVKAEVENNLDTNIAKVEDEIASERARIDQLVASPEMGEGDFEKEVEDLRIDTKGTTHGSAGTAVRKQFQDLDSKIDDNVNSLSSEIANVENGLSNKYKLFLPLWELGYINGSNGEERASLVNARTIDILHFHKGDTIEHCNYQDVLVAVHTYDNEGNWVSYQGWQQLTGINDGVYTFTEDMDLRFSISYKNGSETNVNDMNNYLIMRLAYCYERLNKLENFTSNNEYWKGKKIVWFGTSIPAGVVNAGESGGEGAYPTRIGEMLGATVYNESIGSSGVRGGNHNYITENDTMGYSGLYATSLMLSLSLSSTEKQAIIDEWETKWKDLIPMSDSVDVVNNKDWYLASSWDIKLAKYLSGGSVGQVDLYVFDVGHNDAGYNYNFDDIPTIPSDGKTSTDRTYFIGAMNFLIGKILSDNPKARICFIGHYENDRKNGISEAQEVLANIWKYPLFKTWEYIGWSQNKVVVDGVEKTITQIWMPDDLHPSSDTSGKALQHYANVLYPFMRDIR